MAGLRVPALDPTQAPGLSPLRIPFAPEDTTQGPQGGAAIAQAGQQLGAGIEQAAGSLYAVAQDAKKQHDQSIVLGKYGDLATLTTQLWKDPTVDPVTGQPKGASYLKGDAALGVTDKVLKVYDQRTQQMARDLTDKDQRAAFSQLVVHHRATLAEQLAGHEGDQLQQADTQKFGDGLKGTISQAGLFWNDPRALDLQMAIGTAAIVTRANAQKWSPQQTEQMLRAYRTEIVSSVIKIAAENNGSLAKSLWLKYSTPGADGDTSHLIDGAKLGEIYPEVKRANVADVSREWVDRLRVQAPRDLGAQRDLARAAIKDTDVLNATVAQLETNNAIDDKADSDKLAFLAGRAYNAYLQAPPDQRNLNSIPPALQAQLRDNADLKGAPQFWAQMEGFDREQRLSNFNRPPRRDEMSTLGNFILDLDQRGALYSDWKADHVIALLGGRVPDAQLQHGIAALLETQKNEANRDPTRIPSPIIEQQVLAAGDAAGLWNSKKKRDAWEPQELASLAYAAGEIRKQMADIRTLPPDKQQAEIQRRIAELFAPGKVAGSGFLWDTRTSAAGYATDANLQGKGAFVPAVTRDQRNRVNAQYKKLQPDGPALTDDQIQRILIQEQKNSNVRKTIAPPAGAPAATPLAPSSVLPNLGVVPMPAPVGPLGAPPPPLPEVPKPGSAEWLKDKVGELKALAEQKGAVIKKAWMPRPEDEATRPKLSDFNLFGGEKK